MSKSFGGGLFFLAGLRLVNLLLLLLLGAFVRTYSKFLSVSGVVLFTFPSLKSAVIRVQGQMWISGFAVIDYVSVFDCTSVCMCGCVKSVS